MMPSTAAVRLLSGYKEPVRLATTANISLSGLLTIDGVVSERGDRILVKDQTDATQNGIYTASEGTWRRAPDSAAARSLQRGMKVFIQEGTQTGQEWVVTSDEPDIGDDAVTFDLYLSIDIIGIATDAATDAAASAADAAASAALIGSAVLGSGSSLVGNVPQLSNTTARAIIDSGNPASALPVAPGHVPARTPSASVVAISIGVPGIVTWAGHGLAPNATVVPSTTGTLPTGLVAGTTYYVVGSSITTNTFKLATSVANAKAGVAITTSGSQSGVHTLTANLDAATNCIGAYLEVEVPSASFVTLPSPTGFGNVVTISLPAGDWDVQGSTVFASQTLTEVTEMHTGLSLTSNALDRAGGFNADHAMHVDFLAGHDAIFPTGLRRFALTQTTTIYLVAQVTNVSGTPAMLAYGKIRARRW